MTCGIQTMPMWFVDLLVLLALLKLSHRLDLAKELERLSLMTSVVLGVNHLYLTARILDLESITVAMEKMLEFVVKCYKVCDIDHFLRL